MKTNQEDYESAGAGGESGRGERIASMNQNLEAALEADDPSTKDYYVRAALQRVVFEQQNSPD